MAQRPKQPRPPFVCEFRHGVQLTVTHSLKPVPLRQVTPILDSALSFFKHHRDTLKTGLYKDGPYIVQVGNGTVTLSHPGDESGQFLTPAQWTDALSWAYSVADTIGQIIKELAAYRAADTTGSMSYLLELLPSHDLEALRVKLRRSP
jgi:hypothetical protein